MSSQTPPANLVETTQAKPNRPWYKKWWVWLVALFILGGIGNALDGSPESGTEANPTPAAEAPANEEAAAPEANASDLAPNEARISRADLGEDWPFTVEEGIIRGVGEDGFGAVYFMADGKVYPVNGLAKQSGLETKIEDIWADNPAIPGTKIDIGPIIDRGLELCR